MTRYNVYSVDMWGHVPADCCASYDCPCVTKDDDGNETHDENACECHEDMNDRFRCGSVEASDDASLIGALYGASLLSEKGRDTCTVEDDNGMGECLDIRDPDGRLIFYIESEEA